MDYKSWFTQHPDFTLANGVFRQKNFSPDKFESIYRDLREKEGWIYDDNTVQQLPDVDFTVPNFKRWQLRSMSARRLITFLKKRKVSSVLEVGCGNGWLMDKVNRATGTRCCGLDINLSELEQAARVFGKSADLTFVFGDPLNMHFEKDFADVVLLASTIQYFAVPEVLISKLLTSLTPRGELHILDSPFYDDDQVSAARLRSEKYFESVNATEMKDRYHHHTLAVLRDFKYEILYQPASLINRFSNFFKRDTPFPWIVVRP